MKQLKYLFLVLGLVLIAGFARADCKGMGGMCNHHGKECPMGGEHQAGGTFLLDEAKNLNLTDSQVVKLNHLRIEMKESLDKKEEESNKATDELTRLVHSDKPNRKAIEEKTKEIGKLEGEMDWIEAQALLDAYAQLTPAQLKKLDQTK